VHVCDQMMTGLRGTYGLDLVPLPVQKQVGGGTPHPSSLAGQGEGGVKLGEILSVTNKKRAAPEPAPFSLLLH